MALDHDLLSAIKGLGGSLLASKMNTMRDAIAQIPELGMILDLTPSRVLRRISWFPDREVKMRVIAILDYYSQTALKPFHHYLFRILKRIPQDMTFNQGAFTQSIHNREIYYSVDLTAATDRFPIWLISSVLRGHLPDQYVTDWETIMIGKPFKFTNHEGISKDISYGVGNPMGAYSS
jgi:hypothetical protein